MGLIKLENTLKIGIKVCPHIPRESKNVHMTAFFNLLEVTIRWL